ncbi:peptidoglycan-binding protein [Streptomyces sp. Go40/10]|uniref:peptidoglycan-binding protein n=1 Tax=Streptomyces sp. Go40/10 TaxID=2825844 RepID=UPI001E3709F0|nr:peptidoglycan-binding protein [Streptomyces sp. Go40/10]UFR04282.1 peptidoglycan-binding protein [Streptomyces sp. Go40/10]
MTAPVFEDVDPASDCGCPGCVHGRRAAPRPPSGRGRPAARGVVVVAAASAALATVPPAAALAPDHSPHRQALPGDGAPDTPQGAKAPLHGQAGRPGGPATAPIPATTRTQIINRAKVWVAAQVPYSMYAFWSDGYRQDCSGYVSMAWGLPNNEWTGSLGQFGVKITKEELQPGDILLYHNPDNPEKGSHVVIFGGWTDHTHTSYTVYEQTPPHTRRQATPYPYWSNADKYVPYRYKGVTKAAAVAPPAADGKAVAPHPGAAGSGPGAPASHGVPGYPGRRYFRPGAANDHVTRLGAQLVKKGFGRFYDLGPGPHWGDSDRRAVEAFQRAQGWRGGAADGYPGPETWRRLFA